MRPLPDDWFTRVREGFTCERMALSDRKAEGYTEGNEDRLWNFKNIGNSFGVPAKHVLGVYLFKHWSSLVYWMKTGVESGDGIEQTLMDISNYLDLLYAMIIEDKEEQSE